MPKKPLAVTIGLPIVVLLFTVVAIFGVMMLLKTWWGLPFDFLQPTSAQPIDFRHDVHVEAQIDCQFCHRTVADTETAGIPAVQQCYFCHKDAAIDSQNPGEVEKIRFAFEQGEPINWVRIHRLPDQVQFVHDAHVRFFSDQNNVAISQTCSICHGDVAAMGVPEQVRNLNMRDCVDCHRGGYFKYLDKEAELAIRHAVESGHRLPPPTDCAACHY